MMERQGLVRRRVGSGTFLTEDARDIFVRMDQTDAARHEAIPSFPEIIEGRLLFEPAMMHLVVNRVQEHEIDQMRRVLGEILDAPTWEDFKEAIYGLHRQMFAATQEQVPRADHGVDPRRSPRGALRRARHRPARAPAGAPADPQGARRNRRCDRRCATASAPSSWFPTT